MAYAIYDDFAWFFNRYWADDFLQDLRPGFESFFLPRLPPGSRVLDVGCGTGQAVRLLHARRFEAVGVDGSQEMLALARRNAPEAQFEQRDVRVSLPAGPFRAAVSLFDTVNHFAPRGEVDAVFGNVFDALAPGGLFLFDVNTEEGFREAAAETYADVEEQRVCIVKTRFDAQAGRGVSAVTLFRLQDGGWRRRDFEIEEFLHDRRRLEAILREVGFVDVQVLSAEDDFGMRRGCGRVFFLAAKP